ncbi:MAG: Gfo/Idh/MocA family oxidoreductase [Phycisphaerae bacterium]|nr:Gfo/Idh/MocA family oxidoreductase [Phycisphaerae bacterium]
MARKRPVRVTIIGCGGMARAHLNAMLKMRSTTRIPVVCEPSRKAYEMTAEMFTKARQTPPPNEPDLKRLLKEYKGKLDAAFIITPHAYHHDQTKACLQAGLDVLLEKPMVMNAREARSLIRVRDKTRKLLVVAFPGSLSPQVRTAVKMLRSGKVGKLLTISGTVWQNWGPNQVGQWRQVPEIAGGGFMFDTGAHMLNTVTDLAGQDFAEVAAWLDNCGRPVDTLAAIMGRLKSGAMVTIHGCGEAIPSCQSQIQVFCQKAIIRTGVWGESLDMQRHGCAEYKPIKVAASKGVWEQFLLVRAKKMKNPCPPEVGLRMAKLWDAIKASSAKGGAPVKCR